MNNRQFYNIIMQNKNTAPLSEEKKKSKEQQKKEEEIKETEDQIRQSQEEIREEVKFKEKVPLPELAKEDLSGLSEEAKEILKSSKNLREKKEEEEEKAPEKKISLEEAVDTDRRSFEQGHNLSYGQEKFSGYIQELSQEPVYKIKQEMQSMYESLQDKGYMTAEEQQKARNRLEAMEEKMRAIDRGIYSMSEEAAEEASLIKKIGNSLLHNSYKAHSSSQYQN